MELTVGKGELERALNKLNIFIEKENKSNRKFVNFRVRKTYTLISIDNIEKENFKKLTIKINAKSNKREHFSLNLTDLKEIIENLPEAKLKLKKIDRKNIEISFFNRRQENSIMIERFEFLEKVKDSKSFNLITKVHNRNIKSLLNKLDTLYLKNSDFKNTLKAKIKDGNLIVYNTDGYRVFKSIINTRYKEKVDDLYMLVPKENVISLKDILKNSGFLKIYQTEKGLGIKTDKITFETNSLNKEEGTLSNIEKSLQNPLKQYLITDKEYLLKSVKAIKNANKNINDEITLEQKNGALSLYNKKNEKSKINIKTNIEFKDFITNLNSNYLIDGLNVIKSEEVNIYVNKPLDMIVIKEIESLENEENKDKEKEISTYYLMPLRS